MLDINATFSVLKYNIEFKTVISLGFSLVKGLQKVSLYNALLRYFIRMYYLLRKLLYLDILFVEERRKIRYAVIFSAYDGYCIYVILCFTKYRFTNIKIGFIF